jgi:hypothetical protein
MRGSTESGDHEKVAPKVTYRTQKKKPLTYCEIDSEVMWFVKNMNHIKRKLNTIEVTLNEIKSKES